MGILEKKDEVIENVHQNGEPRGATYVCLMNKEQVALLTANQWEGLLTSGSYQP